MTTNFFPDAPMHHANPDNWKSIVGPIGKPFTIAEKRAIFGDAYMVPSNLTNLKPIKHEPAVRILSTATMNGVTTESVAIGAVIVAETAPVVAETAQEAPDPVHPVPALSRLRAERRAKRDRLTAHAVAEIAARVCPQCGTPAEPSDRFCGECGTRLTHDAIAHETPAGAVSITSKYHGKNPDRIYAQCPHATDVRGFHDWLKAGRAVQKGQKGIMIFTPAGGMGEDADDVIDERRPRVKKAYVFDISQTAPCAPRASQPARTSHAAAD